jgi:hypothetical protein
MTCLGVTGRAATGIPPLKQSDVTFELLEEVPNEIAVIIVIVVRQISGVCYARALNFFHYEFYFLNDMRFGAGRWVLRWALQLFSRLLSTVKN